MMRGDLQSSTAMLTVSLSELRGFPKFYLEVVKGHGTGSRGIATGRDRLLLKMKEAARPMAPGLHLIDLIKQETPWFARSPRWEKSVEMLALEQPSLILAMPRIGRSGGAMAQLLKCITAARLAHELELEGLPAIPFCCAMMQNQAMDRSFDGRGADSSALERAAQNLTVKIRYLLKVTDTKDNLLDNVQPDATERISALARGLLTWAGREFGWLVVDSGSRRLRAGSEMKKAGSMNSVTHRLPAAKRPDPERRQAEEDDFESMAALATDLPIGAIVVGPDDCLEAVRIADRIESAGYSRPVLFPRLSATVLRPRDCRVMRKYGLRLVDLLVPVEALQAGLVRDQRLATIAGGIDAVARSVETAAEQITSGVADRPRLSRRIQAAGARIIFQLRKLEARAKAACETRRVIRDRQVKRLRERAAPEGELQEDCYGTVEFLERFSLPGLSALYQVGDIWNYQHQLICLDENT